MERVYVGLDTATVTGIAIYYPNRYLAKITEIKGTPVEQLNFILKYLLGGELGDKLILFSIEKQHHFRNANTTRSLLERYGYFKHTLEAIGYAVREVSPLPVRSHFNVASKVQLFDYLSGCYLGKHLTNNHTDALATAMYQAWLDGCHEDMNLLRIEDLNHEHVAR